MREILFRGKRLDNGEWVEGFYNYHDYIFNDEPVRRHYILPLNAHDAVVVFPETVGQYTGLKDKNGKKIFEGDIVEAVLPRSKAQNGFVWPLMPVVFRDGIFGLLTDRDHVVTFRSFSPAVTLEVKGNIHDHPEMLKGDKANEG